LCRELWGGGPAGEPEPQEAVEAPENPESITPTRICPHCGAGRMIVIGEYIWRQWKNGRTRYAQLRRLGVPHFLAAVAAGSESGYGRMARHVTVQRALPNADFDSLGLPRLAPPPTV
jgi:hypothetical protein